MCSKTVNIENRIKMKRKEIHLSLIYYAPVMIMAGALSVTPVHPSVLYVRTYVPTMSAL